MALVFTDQGIQIVPDTIGAEAPLIPPGINDSFPAISQAGTSPGGNGGNILGTFGGSSPSSSPGLGTGGSFLQTLGSIGTNLVGGLFGGGGTSAPPPPPRPLPPISDIAADFRSQIPEFGRGVDLNIQPLDASFALGAAGDISNFGRAQTGLNIDEAFGRARPLAGLLSQDRLGQFQSILGAVSPQALAIQQGRDNAILSFLSGQVPADVADQIARLGAERATRSGIGVASGRARNLEARDLGLTSLDLINRGLTASLQALPQDRALASSLTVDPTTLGASFLNTLQQATVAPPSALIQAATTASTLNQEIAFIREVAIQQRAITALELAVGLEQANIDAGSTSSLAATQRGLTRDIATGQLIGSTSAEGLDTGEQIGRTLGQAAGTAIGAFFGGPVGATIGSTVGAEAGEFIGGEF